MFRKFRSALFILTITFLGTSWTLNAGEDKEKKSLDQDKIIREGIIAFRKAVRSDKEKERISALNRVIPDKSVLIKLLGKSDADVLWGYFHKNREFLLSNSERFKEEMDRAGDIQTIKLQNMRTNDRSGRYKEIAKIIPAEIPLFTAIIKSTNGSGGSSTYLVIDGKFYWFRGLEAVPEVLPQMRKEAKARKEEKKETSSPSTPKSEKSVATKQVDDKASHPKSLHGIWKLKSVTVNGKNDKESDTYLSIRSDGTYRNIKKGKKPEGPWQINKDNKLIFLVKEQVIMQADWKVEGNNLTLSFEDGPAKGPKAKVIIKYTRTTLTKEPKAIDEK